MKLKLDFEHQRCCFAVLKRHLQTESCTTSTTNIFHPLLQVKLDGISIQKILEAYSGNHYRQRSRNTPGTGQQSTTRHTE